jgi:hypothetical protein
MPYEKMAIAKIVNATSVLSWGKNTQEWIPKKPKWAASNVSNATT